MTMNWWVLLMPIANDIGGIAPAPAKSIALTEVRQFKLRRLRLLRFHLSRSNHNASHLSPRWRQQAERHLRRRRCRLGSTCASTNNPAQCWGPVGGALSRPTSTHARALSVRLPMLCIFPVALIIRCLVLSGVGAAHCPKYGGCHPRPCCPRVPK